jgi:predicted aconitase
MLAMQWEKAMELTAEQQAIRDGKDGEVMQLVMETLVRYGESFQAPRLVPIKSAHLTGSFAIASFTGYYELLDKLVKAGITVKVPTTINPRPGYDYSMPNKLVAFRKQKHHEEVMGKLGVTGNWSCVCYTRSNVPAFGDILGWAESSAVVYANSVIGARTNRNSLMVDMCMAVTGLAPEFGLLYDENRKGNVLVKLDVDEMDDDAVGFIVGQQIVDKVPVLTHYPFDKVQLKNLGATMAASGGVGMFHVEGVTPECPSLDAVFTKDPEQVITITQKDIDGIRLSAPKQEETGLVVFGCPQMTLDEVKEVGRHFVGKKVKRRTFFHIMPEDYADLVKLPLHQQLLDAGVELFEHCPLAGLTVRLKPKDRQVLTNSGKLHYYLNGGEYGNTDDLLRIAGVK